MSGNPEALSMRASSREKSLKWHVTGCVLFQAHKDRWVPGVSSVEERTFLAMIKRAAVRANELPKIRNVQVYAPNDLLNPRFCGFMTS